MDISLPPDSPLSIQYPLFKLSDEKIRLIVIRCCTHIDQNELFAIAGKSRTVCFQFVQNTCCVSVDKVSGNVKDNFGRNYRNTKKFRQVLSEFDSDAGVRYNPDLVKLIHDVPSLYDKTAEIVDSNRMDYYYDIYKLYFR